MENILSNIIIFALINTAVLICLYKWKIVDRYERYIHWPSWCEFCLCFWLSVAEYLFCTHDITFRMYIHIPFYALASAAASVFFFKPDSL